MKPPSERNRAIAARRGEGVKLQAIAAEFRMTVKGVREIARRVEHYDRGAAVLRLDPSSLEGLELTGRISRLVRISLEARGIKRLDDLDAASLDDLIRWPNIGRKSAAVLIDLYAELKRSHKGPARADY